jgi:hypothetical protein
MLRYARYTAAVLFALLAVGFVALWVRSYGVKDRILILARSNAPLQLTMYRGRGGLRLVFPLITIQSGILLVDRQTHDR